MSQDKTQKERQRKRRKALDEAAKAAGFKSWSAYETAVINKTTKMNLMQRIKITQSKTLN